MTPPDPADKASVEDRTESSSVSHLIRVLVEAYGSGGPQRLTELLPNLPFPDENSKESDARRDLALQAIHSMAVNLSTARNVIGIGRLVENAQEAVQVLRNDRTGQVGFLLGPDLVKEVIDQHLAETLKSVEFVVDAMISGSEIQSAFEARERFLEVSRRAERIRVEVPVPRSGKPSHAIDL